MKRPIAFLLSCLLALLVLTSCANDDALYVYTRACEALEAESYDEAQGEFARLIDYGYYVAESYRGIGLAYLRQADYPDACIAFERSLINVTTQEEDFIKDTKLYLALCRTLRGERDKAMDIYDELLRAQEDPEVYFLRGCLHMDAGDEGAAGEDFDRAAGLGTDYALIIKIYQVYENAGKNADGSRYLEKALDTARKEGDAYERGLVLYYLRDYEAAKEELQRALLEKPDEGNVIFLLGRVYLSMGNIADARAMFKEHLDEENNAAAAYNGLSLCDIEEGAYAEALLNIQKGLACRNEEAEKSLLFHQIIVYEYLHEWETAKNLAAVYVGRYPEETAALREYEFLKSRAE